jgi:hypothetical protein
MKYLILFYWNQYIMIHFLSNKCTIRKIHLYKNDKMIQDVTHKFKYQNKYKITNTISWNDLITYKAIRQVNNTDVMFLYIEYEYFGQVGSLLLHEREDIQIPIYHGYTIETLKKYADRVRLISAILVTPAGAVPTGGGITTTGAVPTGGGITPAGAMPNLGGITPAGAVPTGGGITTTGAVPTGGGITTTGAVEIEDDTIFDLFMQFEGIHKNFHRDLPNYHFHIRDFMYYLAANNKISADNIPYAKIILSDYKLNDFEFNHQSILKL